MIKTQYVSHGYIFTTHDDVVYVASDGRGILLDVFPLEDRYLPSVAHAWVDIWAS